MGRSFLSFYDASDSIVYFTVITLHRLKILCFLPYVNDLCLIHRKICSLRPLLKVRYNAK